MPETVVPDTTPQGGKPQPPRSIKDQLDALDAKIAEFEAEKNDEKQAALRGIVQASDDAIANYPYDDLRTRWCRQQESVEALHRQLVGAFPKPPWPDWRTELIETCICSNLATVSAKERQLRTQLEQREVGGKGSKELLRDRAQKSVVATQSLIEALLALPGDVKSIMDANDDLIDAVRERLQGPDPATALYPFWFQLAPAHQQLRPTKVKQDCRRFESPAELCAQQGSAPEGEARALPWLMTHAELLDALRDAWEASQNAAEDLAAKEIAFREARDSIDLLTEDLGKLQDGVRAAIDECLTKATPQDDCCTSTASGSHGANDA